MHWIIFAPIPQRVPIELYGLGIDDTSIHMWVKAGEHILLILYNVSCWIKLLGL